MNNDTGSASSTSCLIRPLHPSDAGPLYDLLGEPTLLSCGHFEPAAEFPAFQGFVERPQGDQHRLVAVRDGQPVALGLLERPPNPRVAHLGQISLMALPERQGQEIGAALLEALIDIAEKWLNLRRLEAKVPSNAPAVQQIFQQSGFVAEGILNKALYGDGQFQDEVSLARLNGFEAQEGARRRPAPEPPKPSVHMVPDLLIRPLGDQDAEELCEIYRSPGSCRTTLQLPSQELWLTRKRIQDRSATIWRLVAISGGRVVGVITMRPRAQRCRAHVAGLGMTVHTDYWGLGIGSRLMERMMELADRWLNLTRVELIVHTDNPAGIRLYEKFGFVIEGIKPLHTYGDGGWVDSYFMARVAD